MVNDYEYSMFMKTALLKTFFNSFLTFKITMKIQYFNIQIKGPVFFFNVSCHISWLKIFHRIDFYFYLLILLCHMQATFLTFYGFFCKSNIGQILTWTSLHVLICSKTSISTAWQYVIKIPLSFISNFLIVCTYSRVSQSLELSL